MLSHTGGGGGGGDGGRGQRQRRRQRAKDRGQRRSLLLPAVAHRRKMGLRQRGDFSPFVLYLFCGFLMGRSVKNIVNHHCFVGFSLHSVFELGTNTTARNDFFFFFFSRTHFTAASPFVLWVSLYTLFFWVTPYNITCFCAS